jgi:hypothetical protein
VYVIVASAPKRHIVTIQDIWFGIDSVLFAKFDILSFVLASAFDSLTTPFTSTATGQYEHPMTILTVSVECTVAIMIYHHY